MNFLSVLKQLVNIIGPYKIPFFPFEVLWIFFFFSILHFLDSDLVLPIA